CSALRLLPSPRSCLPSVPSPPVGHALCLHDALPILQLCVQTAVRRNAQEPDLCGAMAQHSWIMSLVNSVLQLSAHAAEQREEQQDRKSTRLNSSHVSISYAVLCLQKTDGAQPSGGAR